MIEPQEHSDQKLPHQAENAEASFEVGTKRPSALTMPRLPMPPHLGKFARIVGLIVICVVSSGLTAWLLVKTGIVKQDVTNTITQNRDKLVLQEGEVVSDVFKQVSPSTVAITTEAASSSRFFGTTVEEGAGSGIIISKDGYVLTNKHVIPDGTSKVSVVLADGREFDNVTVAGRDPFNDIAFLKIQGVSDLPAAKVGDSSVVTAGQKVVAIGNALGQFRNSVTTGIISGIGRPLEASDGSGSSEQLENLFQTDAAINHGNSGGPLLNLQGEVIGINTAIAEQSQGIGFAIPINDAKGMINTMLTQGKIIKPYLGVRYITLTKEIAKELNLSVTSGVYVYTGTNDPAVVPGSPADKAGIREQDIIQKVGDTMLTDTNSFASMLAQSVPGDKVSLTILRGGKTITLTVTLAAYPS
jgi:S1-C subfamily serine protease